MLLRHFSATGLVPIRNDFFKSPFQVAAKRRSRPDRQREGRGSVEAFHRILQFSATKDFTPLVRRRATYCIQVWRLELTGFTFHSSLFTLHFLIPGFRKDDVSKKRGTGEHRDRELAKRQWTRAKSELNPLVSCLRCKSNNDRWETSNILYSSLET